MTLRILPPEPGSPPRTLGVEVPFHLWKEGLIAIGCALGLVLLLGAALVIEARSVRRPPVAPPDLAAEMDALRLEPRAAHAAAIVEAARALEAAELDVAIARTPREKRAARIRWMEARARLLGALHAADPVESESLRR